MAPSAPMSALLSGLIPFCVLDAGTCKRRKRVWEGTLVVAVLYFLCSKAHVKYTFPSAYWMLVLIEEFKKRDINKKGLQRKPGITVQ